MERKNNKFWQTHRARGGATNSTSLPAFHGFSPDPHGRGLVAFAASLPDQERTYVINVADHDPARSKLLISMPPSSKHAHDDPYLLFKYSIWKGFDNWIVEAAGRERWMLLKRDFVFFTLHNSWSKILHSFSFCLRPKGAAFWPASFDFDFEQDPTNLYDTAQVPPQQVLMHFSTTFLNAVFELLRYILQRLFCILFLSRVSKHNMSNIQNRVRKTVFRPFCIYNTQHSSQQLGRS